MEYISISTNRCDRMCRCRYFRSGWRSPEELVLACCYGKFECPNLKKQKHKMINGKKWLLTLATVAKTLSPSRLFPLPNFIAFNSPTSSGTLLNRLARHDENDLSRPQNFAQLESHQRGSFTTTTTTTKFKWWSLLKEFITNSCSPQQKSLIP